MAPLGLTVVRPLAALALLLLALLPMAGAPRAAASPAGRDDAYTFRGSGGAIHTFGLQGGRYVINVYAGFLRPVPSPDARCSFSATLAGIEHPLSYNEAHLGVTEVGGFFPYRYIPTVDLQKGHYTLTIAPLTDCDWSVSIGGGGTSHAVIAIGDARITHLLAGQTETTTVVETTNATYSFGVTYGAWGAGFAAPTASVSLLQGGRLLHTYALTPAVGDYGQTAFATALRFPATGGARPGPYTARFTIALGGTRATRSVDYVVQPVLAGHWTLQASRITAELDDIACPSPTQCISPGHGATLVGTTDGHTWSRRATPLDSSTFLSLNGAACPTVRTCYVVGDQYFILASADGGRTWRLQNGDTTYTSYGQNLIAVACPAEQHCYTVGFGGVIATTSDGGAHWTTQAAFGTGKDLVDVACPAVRVCNAVGRDGTIVRTADGGSTWHRTAVATPYLLSIACPTVTTCYAVGEQGTIVATTDGGATWRRQNNPLNGSHLWIDSVACATVRACRAVGQAGTLLLTSDGGRTWYEQTSPTAGQLNVVACPASPICYAVGSRGIIIKGT